MGIGMVDREILDPFFVVLFAVLVVVPVRTLAPTVYDTP